MAHPDYNLFRSRLARQTFTLFVLTALLPVAFIAIVSFDHVSSQLRQQSYELSRQASKTIAMELIHHLRALGEELAEMPEHLKDEHAASLTAGHPRLADDSYPEFDAVTRVAPGQAPVALRGEPLHLPALTDLQSAHLSAGQSLLSLQPGLGRRAYLLLCQRIDTADPDAGFLIGRISPASIATLENLLPSTHSLQLVGPGNRLIYAQADVDPDIVRSLDRRLGTAISGHFEWTSGSDRQLAGYWSLFTRADFGLPYVVVMVSQDERRVLAPVADFRTRYLPGLLVLILAVALVSGARIRRKLAPVVHLRDATRRVADGRFDSMIEITGDDELAELGRAFNTMTDRLNSQFTSISTMAEIDRLILSSFDTRYIIATVLSRAADLTPCAVAAVLEFDATAGGTARLWSRNAADSEAREVPVTVSAAQIRELEQTGDGMLVCGEDDHAGYLADLRSDATRAFLLLPTFVKQRLQAVIVFGYESGHLISGETRERLRKFADHVAVALSNARWEARLYHQAHYDTLTGLPNRALLQDRLEQALARGRRNDSSVGVIFIDLDRFKLVNDSLGHTSGDRLLQEFAALLTDCVRSVDTVVRFGGDEFVLIIPDIGIEETGSSLGAIAAGILERTRREIRIGDHRIRAEASIGIAVYPRDGLTADELIKHADTAMYHAKDQGRGCYRFFAPELNEAATQRLNLELELRHALDNGELRIHYQPKVRCVDNALTGAEALIRWEHPTRGLVPPSEFIPTAEETGFIKAIGEWVLHSVCRQIRAWRDAGLPGVRVAVNVSPRQFNDTDISASVAHALNSCGLDAAALELEVTEGSVMKNTAASIDKLRRLHQMGVHLSVDDFGTGYSSLSYLKSLPLHTLKIDRSFIVGMIDDPRAEAIVSTIVVLAHNLQLSVVAEGVENETQRSVLERCGCDEYQGYLHSRPLTAAQFEKLLEKQKNTAPQAETR